MRPRFEDKTINGALLVVTDVARIEPLEVGIHVLTAIFAQAQSRRVTPLLSNLAMFHAIAGTERLYRMLMSGSDGGKIVAAWQAEAAQFKARRARYLLY